MEPLAIDTPYGRAHAQLGLVEGAVGALLLGHGAGGGVHAPDLVAAAGAACAEGYGVALCEQPYRVAGRRAPAPARQLDVCWIAVVDALRASVFAGLPLIVGGRSSGARVACRTAIEARATAVLCLAFPLQPPRPAERPAAESRLPELDALAMPTLIVQGVRDPFGMPPSAPNRTVAEVPGDHALKADLDAVSAAVHGWLRDILRR